MEVETVADEEINNESAMVDVPIVFASITAKEEGNFARNEARAEALTPVVAKKGRIAWWHVGPKSATKAGLSCGTGE